MNEILAMFLRDVLGARPPEYGLEFDAGRAAQAYELISETARDSAELRNAGNPNLFGFFPRITVRDHADFNILHPVVSERATDLREALLCGCGQYALGSEVLQMSELRDLQEEYLNTLRLRVALEAENERWHQEQEQIREATERASAAMGEPEPLAEWEQELVASTPLQNDEALATLRQRLAVQEQTETDIQNHRPVPRHEYAPEALAFIAGADEELRKLAEEGKKIQAIKRLRTLTFCGLEAAKEAVETAYPISLRSTQY